MEKQKMLEILHILQPYRELSEGMIALIEAGFMDKETYQNTFFMVANAIKKLPEGPIKIQLQEQLKNLNKSDS